MSFWLIFLTTFGFALLITILVSIEAWRESKRERRARQHVEQMAAAAAADPCPLYTTARVSSTTMHDFKDARSELEGSGTGSGEAAVPSRRKWPCEPSLTNVMGKFNNCLLTAAAVVGRLQDCALTPSPRPNDQGGLLPRDPRNVDCCCDVKQPSKPDVCCCTNDLQTQTLPRTVCRSVPESQCVGTTMSLEKQACTCPFDVKDNPTCCNCKEDTCSPLTDVCTCQTENEDGPWFVDVNASQNRSIGCQPEKEGKPLRYVHAECPGIQSSRLDVDVWSSHEHYPHCLDEQDRYDDYDNREPIPMPPPPRTPRSLSPFSERVIPMTTKSPLGGSSCAPNWQKEDKVISAARRISLTRPSIPHSQMTPSCEMAEPGDLPVCPSDSHHYQNF